MKDEIRAAIRKMKSSTAKDPDSISIELIEAPEDMELIKSQHCSTKSMTGQILPDIFNSKLIEQTFLSLSTGK